ncbi:MAG: DUF1592 domain-containing protein [Myxococcota bacterium]
MVPALGLLLTGCYSGLDAFDPIGSGGNPVPEPSGAADDDGGGDGPEASCQAPSVGVTPLRRLTRFEYDNTVRDLLGDDRHLAAARFSPDEANGGYSANAVAPISKTQLDEYATAAEDLAVSFLDAGVGDYVDCPLSDSSCATQFVTKFGRRAFRRPLEMTEVDEYVALYEDARDAWDGATGFRIVVEAMLLSPNFLYHMEARPVGAAETDVLPLGGFEMASRMSYFVWASMPDDELLDAAEAGALDTTEGLEAQVRRMLEDERAGDTIASFTRQWVHLEGLGDKVKDVEIFPEWSAVLAASMEHEALAFADEVIRNGDGRLETLLTAPWTMGDASLAELYQVDAPEGEFGRIDLPPAERAGLLTQLGFLTANAHAAETSWVHRGLFVRQNLLCQVLPAPPAGVDVNDPNDAGRLENPECTGCHLMIDPIGWAFDDYDALGVFVGEGEPGDASGSSVGEFDDIVALAGALAQAPEVQDCVASQWFRYATRRAETSADDCALDDIKTTFGASGHDIRELIVAVATSEAFRYHKASE